MPAHQKFRDGILIQSVEVPETIEAIKTEAQRRIIALTGASDLQSSTIKQLNALMRAGELTAKRAEGGTWTTEEASEAAALKALADAVKAIRARSDALELAPPIDCTKDEHWA